MDQRETNMVKSLGVSCVAVVIVLIFMMSVVSPILEKEKREFLEKCAEEGNTCTTPSYPIFYIALGVIPFFVFVGMFDYLEKKRIHNWRSYK